MKDRPNRKEAAQMVLTMFAACRPLDVQEPKAVLEASVEMFMQNPRHVCEAVANPTTGLPAMLTFPPTLADVKRHLDHAYDAMKGRIDRNNALEEQLRRRREDEARRPKPDESKERVMALATAFKAEVKGGKTPEEQRAEAEETLAAAMRDGRWNLEKNPVKISPYLRKYLDHMAAGGTGDEFRQGYAPGSRGVKGNDHGR
jgi:hypothetical protein